MQVAKALGAKVAATVWTADKAEFVRGLGADLVVAMGEEDFVDHTKDWTGGRGLDAVVDNLGGDVFGRSLDALRPLGRLVSMGMVAGQEATVRLRPFFFAQKEVRGTLMGDVEDLQWGLARVREGAIRPALDRTFALGDVAEAHARLAAGAARGSIVLLPWEG